MKEGDPPPVTPGEVLLKEFMEPNGLSARKTAAGAGLHPNQITHIVNGERGITAPVAIKLGERFGTTAEFWMNLQTSHDLEVARRGLGMAPRGEARREAVSGSALTPLQRAMVARLKADGPFTARPNRVEAVVLRSLQGRGLAEWVEPARGAPFWRLTAAGMAE